MEVCNWDEVTVLARITECSRNRLTCAQRSGFARSSEAKHQPQTWCERPVNGRWHPMRSHGYRMMRRALFCLLPGVTSLWDLSIPSNILVQLGVQVNVKSVVAARSPLIAHALIEKVQINLLLCSSDRVSDLTLTKMKPENPASSLFFLPGKSPPLLLQFKAFSPGAFGNSAPVSFPSPQPFPWESGRAGAAPDLLSQQLATSECALAIKMPSPCFWRKAGDAVPRSRTQNRWTASQRQHSQSIILTCSCYRICSLPFLRIPGLFFAP